MCIASIKMELRAQAYYMSHSSLSLLCVQQLFLLYEPNLLLFEASVYKEPYILYVNIAIGSVEIYLYIWHWLTAMVTKKPFTLFI